MAYLEIRNLSIDFGGLRAINRLNMDVEKGEIRGIIGPNGAGKTTLFNLITGVYPPIEGSIYFEGQDLVKLRPHRIPAIGISRTFQNIELFESLSVAENVMTGMHLHIKTGIAGSYFKVGKARKREREARNKAIEILDFVGLADFHDRPATNLSFGQMRLLEIARALAVDPKVILLDEPAAGIHPNKIVEIDTLLGRLRDERGLTILIVEHVLKLVLSISDRVSVLNQGEKIAEGTSSEIKNNTDVVKVYLGEHD
jgi:branched-chain amino acid transport system ATP-binding protein